MAATLKDVRDAIAERWEATSPPTDTSTPYRRYLKLAQADGVMTRRQFFFDVPSGGLVTQWGTEHTTLRTSFDAVFRMEIRGTLDDVFDAVSDEAVLLLNRVNLAPEGTWTDGIEYVRVTRFSVAAGDGYLDLILNIEAVVEESDGAP